MPDKCQPLYRLQTMSSTNSSGINHASATLFDLYHRPLLYR